MKELESNTNSYIRRFKEIAEKDKDKVMKIPSQVDNLNLQGANTIKSTSNLLPKLMNTTNKYYSMDKDDKICLKNTFNRLRKEVKTEIRILKDRHDKQKDMNN